MCALCLKDNSLSEDRAKPLAQKLFVSRQTTDYGLTLLALVIVENAKTPGRAKNVSAQLLCAGLITFKVNEFSFF